MWKNSYTSYGWLSWHWIFQRRGGIEISLSSYGSSSIHFSDLPIAHLSTQRRKKGCSEFGQRPPICCETMGRISSSTAWAPLRAACLNFPTRHSAGPPGPRRRPPISRFNSGDDFNLHLIYYSISCWKCWIYCSVCLPSACHLWRNVSCFASWCLLWDKLVFPKVGPRHWSQSLKPVLVWG